MPHGRSTKTSLAWLAQLVLVSALQGECWGCVRPNTAHKYTIALQGVNGNETLLQLYVDTRLGTNTVVLEVCKDLFHNRLSPTTQSIFDAFH